MPAFPMMVVDLSVQTDWGRGLLRNSPIGDAIIGSPFAAQDDNVYHTVDHPHTGQDFPAQQGIPVSERRGGKIRAYGWDPDAGWWCSVIYPEGWNSFYCHLMQSPIGFNAGQTVLPDTLLGFVGSTGRLTTGPHLHWTLNTADGRIVDPMLYVGPQGRDFIEAPAVVVTQAVIPDALPAPWVDMQTINAGDGRLIIENGIVPELEKLHRLLVGDGRIVRV